MIWAFSNYKNVMFLMIYQWKIRQNSLQIYSINLLICENRELILFYIQSINALLINQYQQS